MIHFRAVSMDAKRVPRERKYPFQIPLLQSFQTLELTAPVTIFVGENGTGKSTLLEGITAAVGSITVGQESIETDPTLQAARELAGALKLTRNVRTRKGFFLRAEDFINYAHQLSKLRAELEAELQAAELTYKDRPGALELAKLPFASSLGGHCTSWTNRKRLCPRLSNWRFFR